MNRNKDSSVLRDDRGAISIYVSIAIMLVIMVIGISFHHIITNNFRNTVDKQLNLEAQYAAETGLFDGRKIVQAYFAEIDRNTAAIGQIPPAPPPLLKEPHVPLVKQYESASFSAKTENPSIDLVDLPSAWNQNIYHKDVISSQEKFDHCAYYGEIYDVVPDGNGDIQRNNVTNKPILGSSFGYTWANKGNNYNTWKNTPNASLGIICIYPRYLLAIGDASREEVKTYIYDWETQDWNNIYKTAKSPKHYLKSSAPSTASCKSRQFSDFGRHISLFSDTTNVWLGVLMNGSRHSKSQVYVYELPNPNSTNPNPDWELIVHNRHGNPDCHPYLDILEPSGTSGTILRSHNFHVYSFTLMKDNNHPAVIVSSVKTSACSDPSYTTQATCVAPHTWAIAQRSSLNYYRSDPGNSSENQVNVGSNFSSWQISGNLIYLDTTPMNIPDGEGVYIYPLDKNEQGLGDIDSSIFTPHYHSGEDPRYWIVGVTGSDSVYIFKSCGHNNWNKYNGHNGIYCNTKNDYEFKLTLPGTGFGSTIATYDKHIVIGAKYSDKQDDGSSSSPSVRTGSVYQLYYDGNDFVNFYDSSHRSATNPEGLNPNYHTSPHVSTNPIEIRINDLRSELSLVDRAEFGQSIAFTKGVVAIATKVPLTASSCSNNPYNLKHSLYVTNPWRDVSNITEITHPGTTGGVKNAQIECERDGDWHPEPDGIWDDGFGSNIYVFGLSKYPITSNPTWNLEMPTCLSEEDDLKGLNLRDHQNNPVGLDFNLGDDRVGYSCLDVDLDPDTLYWEQVDHSNSLNVVLKPIMDETQIGPNGLPDQREDNEPVRMGKLRVKWSYSDEVKANDTSLPWTPPAYNSNDPDNPTRFSDEGNWKARAPVLRISITPYDADGFTREDLLKYTKTYFLYPKEHQNGSCSDPAYRTKTSCRLNAGTWTPSSFTSKTNGFVTYDIPYDIYNAGRRNTRKASWEAHDSGFIAEARCNDGLGGCVAIIRNLPHWIKDSSTKNATCSDPSYTTQTSCTGASHTWTPARAGSIDTVRSDKEDTVEFLVNVSSYYGEADVELQGYKVKTNEERIWEESNVNEITSKCTDNESNYDNDIKNQHGGNIGTGDNCRLAFRDIQAVIKATGEAGGLQVRLEERIPLQRSFFGTPHNSINSVSSICKTLVGDPDVGTTTYNQTLWTPTQNHNKNIGTNNNYFGIPFNVINSNNPGVFTNCNAY